MSIMPKHNTPASGFTLLEVMIAMFIFSIGLLGLASIQGTALQNNQVAYTRTLAMQHAYNMSDLLRAHVSFEGIVNSAFDSAGPALISAPSTQCIVNGTATCSVSDMADFDIYHWQNQIGQDLPSGLGKVTGSAGVYEITIMWDELRTGATGTSCGSDQTVDLKCYTLQVQI